MKKLIDYGEKAIIRDIIYECFPHLVNLHDDAVVIDTKKYKSIAFSTDPCPEPLITYYDQKNKYYHYGRLSVLINYSDLAATGVEPIGVLLSTIMPNDMSDEDYRQFLKGVKDACDSWGGHLLGGNIKDGKSFSVTGTAIGGQVNDNILKRTGINIGDSICVCGDLGMFWLAILKLIDGYNIDDLDDYTKLFVLTPAPKVREGLLLSSSNYISTCMDNSDGLIGCLYELSELNNVSIMIDDKLFQPNTLLKKYCEGRGIDYRNLMLSWGGWDLVFACPKERINDLKSLFAENNTDFVVIGEAISKKKNPVMICRNGQTLIIKDFSSKRFTTGSYFSYGIEACINPLLENQFLRSE